MADANLPDEYEERNVQATGSLDPVRQERAITVLGQASYWLLASRAYRYRGMRTYLVETLVRQFSECPKYAGQQATFTKQETLIWAAWSYVFMHMEDVAALLYSTGEFGKQWDVQRQAEADLIYKLFLSFGDKGCSTAENQKASGANPKSVLEKVISNTHNARRAMWLPGEKEWLEMCTGGTSHGLSVCQADSRQPSSCGARAADAHVVQVRKRAI